jgi:hypothetical protein
MAIMHGGESVAQPAWFRKPLTILASSLLMAVPIWLCDDARQLEVDQPLHEEQEQMLTRSAAVDTGPVSEACQQYC